MLLLYNCNAVTRLACINVALPKRQRCKVCMNNLVKGNPCFHPSSSPSSTVVARLLPLPASAEPLACDSPLTCPVLILSFCAPVLPPDLSTLRLRPVSMPFAGRFAAAKGWLTDGAASLDQFGMLEGACLLSSGGCAACPGPCWASESPVDDVAGAVLETALVLKLLAADDKICASEDEGAGISDGIPAVGRCELPLGIGVCSTTVLESASWSLCPSA